jgi:hypothetical protein
VDFGEDFFGKVFPDAEMDRRTLTQMGKMLCPLGRITEAYGNTFPEAHQ